MQYFFILGNNPTLSLAEISAVFDLVDKNQGEFIAPNIFILNINQDIQPNKLIKRLGGIIKIGKIYNTIQPNNKAIIDKGLDLIDKQEKQGKFKFGISYYGSKHINLKPIGMEIKKYLKEKKISCRWITSKEKTLSSVVVEQNKLTSKGIEIILIEDGNKILLGQTKTVQPFKELSFRDYGRPARDDESGMLPPKLAQIMINLAQANLEDTVLDPFCGSGTILTEAALMGYKNLIGSDISKKAVEDTKQNIKWIKDKFEIRNSKFEIYSQNATQLSQTLKHNSIDAIITEPYLGPQRGKIDIKKTVQELEQLYNKSLTEFKKILKPNGRVVMIWPVFLKTEMKVRFTNLAPSAPSVKAKFTNLAPRLNGFKIIKPLPEYLMTNKNIQLTPKNTIIYGRPEQRIWREIVILEK